MDGHINMNVNMDKAMQLKALLTLMTIIAFLTINLSATRANADDLPSVIEFSKRNDLSDKFIQSSVFARCAGVLGAYAKFLPKSPDSMKQAKETLFNKSMEMLTVSAILLAEKKQVPQSKALEQVQTAFRTYVNMNYEALEKEQIVTGSIMSGKKRSEMDFCLSLEK